MPQFSLHVPTIELKILDLCSEQRINVIKIMLSVGSLDEEVQLVREEYTVLKNKT